MSMFRDAIVSLPNVLGVRQNGDEGAVGTKPDAATGNYINNMSNYCRHCRFEPRKSVGDDA
jgi:deoxyribodipyrimidine photolyase-related protein